MNCGRRGFSWHAREHGPAEGHACLANLAQGTVCKILDQEQVKPHKVRYYLEQRDPEFAEKMAQVLCVYRKVKLLKKAAVSKNKLNDAMAPFQHHASLIPGRPMQHDASYPWEEPGAGNPHARIREGERRMAELLDHPAHTRFCRFRSSRPSPPPFPSMNSMPARCKAVWIARMASVETNLRSFSKSTTVDRPNLAARASCD